MKGDNSTGPGGSYPPDHKGTTSTEEESVQTPLEEITIEILERELTQDMDKAVSSLADEISEKETKPYEIKVWEFNIEIGPKNFSVKAKSFVYRRLEFLNQLADKAKDFFHLIKGLFIN